MGFITDLLGGGGGTTTSKYNTTTNSQQQQQQYEQQLQQAMQKMQQQQSQSQFGTQQQTGTQFSNIGPWAPQQNFILEAFNRANSTLNNPNSRVAAFSPNLQAANTSAINTANMLPQLINQGNEAFTNALNVDVANNPAVRGMINAAISPIDRTLKEDWLPSIGDNFVNTGTYGGSRQGVAEGVALRGAHEAGVNASANILGDAYSQALTTRNNALSMLPSLTQNATAPADILSQVGLRETSRDQALLDEEAKRLQEYFGFVSPSFGQTTTGTTTQAGQTQQQAQAQSSAQTESIMQAIANALSSGTSSSSTQGSSTSTAPKGDPLKGLLGISSLIASLYSGGILPLVAGGASSTFVPNAA